ncbi:serine protein kinase [Aspergillus varians]
MRRFERIHDVVEPNQRYEVIGKLAFGQFSTVWPAHDPLLQQHVALKILKADASMNSKELAILFHLSVTNLDHPGKGHVLELLDHFNHDGPNGTHLCLVLPLMVSDGQGMTVNWKPHQASYVRSISRQTLLGLDFPHALGIVHCDLQPANIMVSTVESARSETLLEPPEFSPVRWLAGTTVDGSAPNCLIATQRRRGQLDGADFSELLVKIGDLGGGKLRRYHIRFKLGTKAHINQLYWISNSIKSQYLNWQQTNEPLFPLGIFGLSAEQIDEEHLGLISQLLGGGGHMNEAFVKHLTDRLPPDFGVGNIQNLASFLWLMLQQEPQKRISTAELLGHPFLTEEIER